MAYLQAINYLNVGMNKLKKFVRDSVIDEFDEIGFAKLRKEITEEFDRMLSLKPIVDYEQRYKELNQTIAKGITVHVYFVGRTLPSYFSSQHILVQEEILKNGSINSVDSVVKVTPFGGFFDDDSVADGIEVLVRKLVDDKVFIIDSIDRAQEILNKYGNRYDVDGKYNLFLEEIQSNISIPEAYSELKKTSKTNNFYKEVGQRIKSKFKKNK